MTKTKRNYKETSVMAITYVLIVFNSVLWTHNYYEGKRMWKEVTEIQIWEERYFQSKSNEVTSIEPEATPMGETARGKTVTLYDPKAPGGEFVASPSLPSNKQLIAEKGKEVFGEHEVEALVELVDRESDFNHTAQNPVSTAYGLFQFLDSTWKAYGCEKTSDPVKQTECGFKYISKRYGSPSKALAYHSQNNSY